MSRVLPILFNTDMILAILDERKTATRRIAKGIVPYSEYGDFATMINGEWTGPISMENLVKLKAKYQRGDILYIRETWCEFPLKEYHYKADYGTVYDKEFYEAVSDPKWRPSIHMPKEAARIWIKVTDVRVERLNDMTFDDFLKEGVLIRPEAFNDPENAYQQAKNSFIDIWDPTIKKSDRDRYSWDANPWTWVTEFERCEKPEGEMGSKG